jgi:hypothetical protein
MDPGDVSWVPEKITSLMDPALSDRFDCSPNAQRTASMILLLPHPLGPAIQVTPSATGNDVFFAMDLKPLISTLFNFTTFVYQSFPVIASAVLSPHAPMPIDHSRILWLQHPVWENREKNWMIIEAPEHM